MKAVVNLFDQVHATQGPENDFRSDDMPERPNRMHRPFCLKKSLSHPAVQFRV
jgi:hypothetical protein